MSSASKVKEHYGRESLERSADAARLDELERDISGCCSPLRARAMSHAKSASPSTPFDTAQTVAHAHTHKMAAVVQPNQIIAHERCDQEAREEIAAFKEQRDIIAATAAGYEREMRKAMALIHAGKIDEAFNVLNAALNSDGLAASSEAPKDPRRE